MTTQRKIVLVTAASIDQMLSSQDKQYVVRVIGKALLALLKRQTTSEQTVANASSRNGIGFTSADAYSATLTAKYYSKWHTLQDWQIEAWTKQAKNGYARLSKYHNQLNEIAIEKKQLGVS